MTEFSSTNQPETRGAGGQRRHKICRDALMLALEREVEHEGKMTRRIVQIAEALARKAADGDVPAAKEIFERVDGKVPTAIAGADGEGPVSVSVIERVIIDPKSAD
jgi:hypothetical protein